MTLGDDAQPKSRWWDKQQQQSRKNQVHFFRFTNFFLLTYFFIPIYIYQNNKTWFFEKNEQSKWWQSCAAIREASCSKDHWEVRKKCLVVALPGYTVQTNGSNQRLAKKVNIFKCKESLPLFVRFGELQNLIFFLLKFQQCAQPGHTLTL